MTTRWIVCLSFAALLWGSAAAEAQDQPRPRVYVILWFDTEDYILPASDDAALRVADFLSRQGIRGTFKVVGEKARTLALRGRKDVIEALKKHEIGFHSNWHSTQPTPAMYSSNLGWDEGVEEFERREGPGARDVERIFGVRPSCYGQPGSSWCPQSYGSLRKWGMVYLDAGSHVVLEGRPCYYAGVFNLYNLSHTIRADLNKPELLEKATARFAQARKKLLAEGGGVVSTVYHPCEWVHKQFWDGVNFAKGANPPRAEWKRPPQKLAEETKLSYRIFADYIAFMKRFDDVEFITASEAARLYADRARQRRFGLAELKKIATAVGDDIGFQKHGDYVLAASEVFDLLNRYVALHTAGKSVESLVLEQTPLGPTSRVARMMEKVTTDDSQLTRTCADVADYIHKHGRLPGTVWLGSTAVSPEAYLAALAKVAMELMEGRAVPKTVELAPAKLGVAKYVSEDRPGLWGWVIFPPGFKAPAMMDLARRQAWTLKPALLHAGSRDTKVQDFTKADLKELGIVLVKPAKDKKTGFIVGGKNSTALIGKLMEIASRSIADLEEDMRPGGLSRLGFMGRDEKLLDVLEMDNRYVVDTLGLTHQELARHLHLLGAVAVKHALNKPLEITYHGKRFRIKSRCSRGFQNSPFKDGTKTNCEAVVENLGNGKKLDYSLLVPYMIERYGFYEGKGTPFRVDPKKVVEVLDFLKPAKQR
jgi:hypothetical protein